MPGRLLPIQVRALAPNPNAVLPIIAWSGSLASIPSGWALCDGSLGTPDLRDRMIFNGFGSGPNGVAQPASFSHAHTMHSVTATSPESTHGHTIASATDTGSVDGGVAGLGPTTHSVGATHSHAASASWLGTHAHTHPLNGTAWVYSGLSNALSGATALSAEARPPYLALGFIMALSPVDVPPGIIVYSLADPMPFPYTHAPSFGFLQFGVGGHLGLLASSGAHQSFPTHLHAATYTAQPTPHAHNYVPILVGGPQSPNEVPPTQTGSPAATGTAENTAHLHRLALHTDTGGSHSHAIPNNVDTLVVSIPTPLLWGLSAQYRTSGGPAIPPTLPIGGIAWWSGALGSIPAGWVLCDGTGGTPNLADVTILGAGGLSAVGDTGGVWQITLLDHTHDQGTLQDMKVPLTPTGPDSQNTHGHTYTWALGSGGSSVTVPQQTVPTPNTSVIITHAHGPYTYDSSSTPSTEQAAGNWHYHPISGVSSVTNGMTAGPFFNCVGVYHIRRIA